MVAGLCGASQGAAIPPMKKVANKTAPMTARGWPRRRLGSAADEDLVPMDIDSARISRRVRRIGVE
jgi:hypothetical protein